MLSEIATKTKVQYTFKNFFMEGVEWIGVYSIAPELAFETTGESEQLKQNHVIP